MRLNASLLWSGLLAAWLALAGVLAAPAMPRGPMLDRAVAEAAPICGQHDGGTGGTDHRNAPPACCSFCVCCPPLLAWAAAPTRVPDPPLLADATYVRLIPGPVAPNLARTIAYPRGPPATI